MEIVTCKHCGEGVVRNHVTRSPQPWTYYPWRHAGTHLFGCFTKDGSPTGTKAEPKESS